MKDPINFLPNLPARNKDTIYSRLFSNKFYQAEQRTRIPETSQVNHSRFNNFLDHLPISIVAVDCTAACPSVAMVNKRAEVVFGRGAAQFKGLPVTRLIKAEMSRGLLKCLQQTEETWSMTLRATAVSANSTPFPARFHVTPDVYQNTPYIFIAIEDLSAEQAQKEESEIITSERQRIAREMHDGVAQDLAALVLKTHLCQQYAQIGSEKLLGQLEELRAIVDQSVVELRRTICGLRPISLEEHGLVAALQALAAEASTQQPLYIQVSIEGDEDAIPTCLELPLFRMAQEAINNIVQHANATHAHIRLSITSGKLLLCIKDNGSGFSTSALWRKIRAGHLGLQQMDERITAHHGELVIRSEEGEGTCISARFPLS